MNASITATGTKGFLLWLKQCQPYLYKRIEKQLPKDAVASLGDVQLSTVGVDTSLVNAPAVSTSSSVSDFLQNLLMGAGQVILTKEQLDGQKKILDLQLDRARAGLPPLNIDPTQYGLPAPNVKLGVDADTKKLLVIGGSIAGGAFLLWLLFASGGTRRRRA